MMSLSDWCRFVPESVGLLVVILVIRAVLPGGSLGSMPHPFWIPVLLMSSQYGIMGGLFATLAATALFFVSELLCNPLLRIFTRHRHSRRPAVRLVRNSTYIRRSAQPPHPSPDRASRTARSDRAGGGDLADGLERAISEIERLEQRTRATRLPGELPPLSGKYRVKRPSVPACQHRRHYSLRCRRDKLCNLSQGREWAGAVPRRRGRLAGQACRDRAARAPSAPTNPLRRRGDRRCAGHDGQ